MMTYEDMEEEANVAFMDEHEFPNSASEEDREAWIEKWIYRKLGIVTVCDLDDIDPPSPYEGDLD